MLNRPLYGLFGGWVSAFARRIATRPGCSLLIRLSMNRIPPSNESAAEIRSNSQRGEIGPQFPVFSSSFFLDFKPSLSLASFTFFAMDSIAPAKVPASSIEDEEKGSYDREAAVDVQGECPSIPPPPPSFFFELEGLGTPFFSRSRSLPFLLLPFSPSRSLDTHR